MMLTIRNLHRQVRLWRRQLQGLIVLALCLSGWAGLKASVPIQAQDSNPYKNYFPLIHKSEIPIFQTGPDIYTTAYYIRTTDPATSYNLGCALGTRDKNLPNHQLNLVILDYGRAIYDSINGKNQYGSRLFTTAAKVDMAQLAVSAQNYGLGYYVCTGSDLLSRVIIGIGTNNYEYDDCPNCSLTYGHGQAWAAMVNTVNAWFVQNNYASQVSAVGANDIELSWNTYERTKGWLDGYDSVNNYEMLNYGALEGCPYTQPTGTGCGGGTWTRDQVWYIVWGAPPVYPVPEIYVDYEHGMTTARQWYWTSVYSYLYHGMAMEFRGVMTQWQACQQTKDSKGVYSDPTCYALDNTPAQGWDQLQTLVNDNPNTAHPILYSTDIRWQ